MLSVGDSIKRSISGCSRVARAITMFSYLEGPTPNSEDLLPSREPDGLGFRLDTAPPLGNSWIIFIIWR